MGKIYHTARMNRTPQIGEIFASSVLTPQPAPDTWWKVVQTPVWMAAVGEYAVTLQVCDPRTERRGKGAVGEHIYGMLRAAPPEPTLGMIYAELLELRAQVANLERNVQRSFT